MATQYEEGYAVMTEWLEGMTADQAEHALTARLATIDNRHPFNRGGSDAAADYVKALR